MPPKKRKAFVIDTNVILHDGSCIYQFGKNDVIIPITVIEELDKFKKGNEIVNLHSRQVLRTLDSISENRIFNGGVSLSAHHGKVIIKIDKSFHRDLRNNFNEEHPDHRILNTAYCLAKQHIYEEVTLVTKDVNLRMKSKAVGLLAEDYTTDHVKDIQSVYKGYRFEENVSKQLIDQMYKEPFEIKASDLKTKKKLLPNEFIVLRNDKVSALGCVDPEGESIQRIHKKSAYGIKPRNVEQTFALHALMNNDIKLITISGKAGTGKTLLALAGALENRTHYRQIFLARPVVPLSNKDLGYLPGNVHDKLAPYMQPLYDNLGVIKNIHVESDRKHKSLLKLLDEEKLIIAPLTYIRGRSLVDTFFIVDEAQNLTPHEIKTIITRSGENTKMIFSGDIFQIDHPYLDTYSNGLSYLIDKMQGQPIYTHINLEKGERSELAEMASNLL